MPSMSRKSRYPRQYMYALRNGVGFPQSGTITYTMACLIVTFSGMTVSKKNIRIIFVSKAVG